MQTAPQTRAAALLNRDKRRRRWHKAVGGLACVVVFCTTYALILPAVTMSAQPTCGLEEHTHTGACYTLYTADPDAATPETARDGELVLTCTLPEHTHTEACYADAQTEQAEQAEQTEQTAQTEQPATPETAATPESAAFALTAQTDGGITVTVTGDASALPCPAAEVTVQAVPVTDEAVLDAWDEYAQNDGAEHLNTVLLDITLWHNGEEIEPTAPVTVTFSGVETGEKTTNIYHIDDDTKQVENMDAAPTGDGIVEMETDHFSTYVVDTANATSWSGTIDNKQTLSSSGTYYLAGDVTVPGIDVTNNSTVTIDLGGKTLSTSVNIYVESGSTLNIVDNGTIKDESQKMSDTTCGNLASLNNNTLTYYVTESKAISDDEGNTTGKTEETLVKHTVTFTGCGQVVFTGESENTFYVKGTLNVKGGIIGNAKLRSIYSDGGKVSISNGLVKGSANGAADGGGICMNGGTLEMTGGYIAGGSIGNHNGGGVWAKGTVTISGEAVIAANQAEGSGDDNPRGGGIFMDSGTLTVSGGVISGNYIKGTGTVDGSHHSMGGGGIFSNSATITLSGGYVTNNKAACEHSWSNEKMGCNHGGGGIAYDNATMEMTGGYVTGNFATLAGGGIYAGFWGRSTSPDGSATFTMSGGTIASNYAQYGEGGGLRVTGGTTAVIDATGDSKIYITNNKNDTEFDWGGGGIFVQKYGTLNVKNTLITNNKAEGYGAGVAACPSGEAIIVHDAGAAIYSNDAEGSKASGGGDGKNYDSNGTYINDTFKKDTNYDDYFCVRENKSGNGTMTLVTGKMLGDGAANWKGSSDNTIVEIPANGYIAPTYITGLTASPDDDAKTAAVNAAKVYITGNSSGVHGGGIMTNGNLVLGNKEQIETPTGLNLTGTKAVTKDSSDVEDKSGYTFVLKDGTDGNAKTLGTGKSDENGNFTINAGLEYKASDFTFASGVTTATRTFTYYLTEQNDKVSGVTYDTAQYTITVTVTATRKTVAGVTFVTCSIADNGVTVNKTGGDTPEPTATPTGDFTVYFKRYDGWNTKPRLYAWVGTGDTKLTGGWPGQDMTEVGSGWYSCTIPASTWTSNNLSSGSSFNLKVSVASDENDQDQTNFTYTPGGAVWIWAENRSYTAPEGFPGSSGSTTGSNVSFDLTSNDDGTKTLNLKGGAAFTNTITTAYKLKLLKTDNNKTESARKPLKGAVFCLKKSTDASDNGTTLTTDESGLAAFAIEKSTDYYLYETAAPQDYQTGGPWIIEVDDNGGAKLYNATEKGDGTLVKGAEVAGAITSDAETTDTNTVTLTAAITDAPVEYTLPETGGSGTILYTMGGLALMLAAALLYKRQTRKGAGTP